MVRIIFALALAMHGLGHLLFVGNTRGYWKTGGTGHARLIGAIGAGQAIEQVAGLLMLLPVAGFLAVTWGYVADQGWWVPLALASAAISAALVLLFWGGLNTSAALFALVFDAAVIAYALWQGRAGVVPGS
jgi:hypothetical protein